MEHKKRGSPKGEISYAWKGDAVGYTALHKWVSENYGRPQLCEHCGTKESKIFDWANVSGTYKRDRDDWIRLCRSCHMKQDRSHRKHVYEYKGLRKSLKEWAASMGVNYYTLYSRVAKYGWTVERALTEGIHS